MLAFFFGNKDMAKTIEYPQILLVKTAAGRWSWALKPDEKTVTAKSEVFFDSEADCLLAVNNAGYGKYPVYFLI